MPDWLPTIRIFISSPSDVRPERLKAEQIIARLDREFAYHLHVEALLWEREPLVATHHFQDPENIRQPRGSDIVVVILWSQLGIPLPEDKFRGAISGRPVTGTEWEFEDALAGARASGVPDLLLYRKQARPTAELHDRKAVEERLAQLDLVEDFIGRWFRSADEQSFTAALHFFAATAEFEDELYDHLHALLELRAGAAPEGVAIRWHQAPFRALVSYEYEDAPVFFGRTRARNELRELLARQIERSSASVLVFGASGSGKSSLVLLAPMRAGIRLTTGAEFARLEAEPTPVQLARAEPIARAVFPLGDPVEPTPWMGIRPCTPDMMPIIGPAPSRSHLWCAFGHAHQGFTLGPTTGRLLAEMMTGEAPFVDPKPFRAERF